MRALVSLFAFLLFSCSSAPTIRSDDASAVPDNEQFRLNGVLTDINEPMQRLDVHTTVGKGSSSYPTTVPIYYSGGTIFDGPRGTASAAALNPGDTIAAYGKTSGGRYVADRVTVINTSPETARDRDASSPTATSPLAPRPPKVGLPRPSPPPGEGDKP